MSKIITSLGGDGREYTLVTEAGRKPIAANTTRVGFRGEKFHIEGGRAPQHSASSGRVWTDKGEFFPSVVGACWQVNPIL